MKFTFPVALMIFATLLTNQNEALSQTSGTLSFTVTTTAPSGSYGTANLFAAWIQDKDGNFVKTKLKYLSGDYVHMEEWINSSLLNVVDAVTGPTRTEHGTLTYLWNGTDVDNAVVSDGEYKAWVEMAWDNSLTTGKAVASYSFTKGEASFSSSPQDLANFKSVKLEWKPLATGTEEILDAGDITVYPNPVSNYLKINFKRSVGSCRFMIFDNNGKILYGKNFDNLIPGEETIPLDGLKPGNYYVLLHLPGRDVAFNIVKTDN